MFVSGRRPVRVGKAGHEADGGEVGGGGGGVGLRGEAARRSGAASEVAVWRCGVAAAARAAAIFGKGDLLRNEPQYPTKGYAPHSGRAAKSSSFLINYFRQKCALPRL